LCCNRNVHCVGISYRHNAMLWPLTQQHQIIIAKTCKLHLFALPSATNAPLTVTVSRFILIINLTKNNFSMKQFIVITCLAVAMASCNNAETTKSGTDSTGAANTAATEVALPFKLDKPYKNWQIGSNENVAAAMGALKAFVDKDFTALGGLIGDSIETKFDYFQGTFSRDSALKMFTGQRALYNDLTINMYDYVSVISADKKDEWVTIWYKQSWKNEKGVADSLAIIDDCKMKNGKMIVLDEHIQHYPAKK
jgi:hypothetical protein